MSSRTLYNNQKNAIKISINNDFESGIHYHATGTGKSWIAMLILLEFNKKYPKSNVLWICERKDILIQQFSKSRVDTCDFKELINSYNTLDFYKNKQYNWTDSINSSAYPTSSSSHNQVSGNKVLAVKTQAHLNTYLLLFRNNMIYDI